jgi:hypothetical protein
MRVSVPFGDKTAAWWMVTCPEDGSNMFLCNIATHHMLFITLLNHWHSLMYEQLVCAVGIVTAARGAP